MTRRIQKLTRNRSVKEGTVLKYRTVRYNILLLSVAISSYLCVPYVVTGSVEFNRTVDNFLEIDICPSVIPLGSLRTRPSYP